MLVFIVGNSLNDLRKKALVEMLALDICHLHSFKGMEELVVFLRIRDVILTN